jgi:O-6-methylguanine DNA methyltransferase
LTLAIALSLDALFMERKTTMTVLKIKTQEGTFTAVFSECGLARLEFPQTKPAPSARNNGQSAPTSQQRRWSRLTAAALQQVLAGKKPTALPPLDWSGSTAFQRRVWKALLHIAPGRTRTYLQIAADAGNPSGARAAGNACGANPVPVLVPCHRVVTANGELGGFSGGLEWKRRLLAREGVALSF